MKTDPLHDLLTLVSIAIAMSVLWILPEVLR